MTGKKRLTILILSIIAFAALTVAALFSVSYAKWEGGSASNVTAEGSVGQFYVDFPYVAQSSQALTSDTYYLAVPNGGVTDYYNFSDVTNDERHVTGVFLKGGTKVTFNYGINVVPEDIYRPSYNAGYHGTLDLATKVFTAAYDAVYDFHLKPVNGGTAFDLRVESSYTNRLNIKYKGKTIKLVLNEWNFNAYIWKGNTYYSDGGFSAVGNWPGTPVAASAEDTQTTAGNTTAIDLSSATADTATEKLSVIFNLTDSGTTYETATIVFDEFAAQFTDPNKLYYVNFDRDEAYKPGSGNKLLTYNITEQPAKPEHVSAAEDASDDLIVRQVSATANAGNSHTFKNYVCVSRMLASGKTDKAVAYVNFEVSGDLNKTVKTFSVKRTATDASGKLTGSPAEVFVYNSPVGQTLAAINSTEPPKYEGESEHINNNYVLGGTYVMLSFGADENQYYALDVTIETESDASFELIARASNIDKRNRYDPGYGEEFGYYLGGEFNGTDMWDPRFAAKLTETKLPDAELISKTYFDGGEYVTYDKLPTKIDVTLEIELTSAGDTFKLYRLDGTGTRQGGDPTLWFIPKNIYKNYIGAGDGDTSALFNKDMNIIVANPGTYKIHYVGDVTYMSTDGYYAYDRKENVFLNEAEYAPRKNSAETYKGGRRYVELGNWNGVVDSLYITRMEDDASDEVTVTLDANGGKFGSDTQTTVKVKWGETLDNGMLTVPTNDGQTFGGWFTDENCTTQYDFTKPVTQIDGLTLYAAWSSSNYNVTYMLNDGTDTVYISATSAADAVIQSAPAEPTREGYVFDGWFKDSDCTNVWKFGSGGDAVTANLTLYAKWTKLHLVTFYANGGTYSDGVEYKSQSVRDGGTVDTTAIEEPAAPTAFAEGYEFGWYTQKEGGEKFNFSTAVTAPIELFAQWNKKANNYYIVIGGEEQWLGTMTGNKLEHAVTIPTGSSLVLYNGSTEISSPTYVVKPSGAYKVEGGTFEKTDSTYMSGNDSFTLILEKSGSAYTATIRHTAWFNTSGNAASTAQGDYFLVGNFSGDRPLTKYKLSNIHVSAYRYNKTAFSLSKYDEYKVRYYTSATEYVETTVTTLSAANSGFHVYAQEYNNSSTIDVKTSAPAKSTKKFYLIGSFNWWTENNTDHQVTNSPDGTQYQVAVHLEANATVKMFCADYGSKYQNNFKFDSSLGSFDGDGNLKVSSAGTYAFYYKEGNFGSEGYNPIYVVKISNSDLT